MLSGCHGAFDSPLRGLRLPDRPGLPGVISALMRHVRAPASWRCPSKRAPALTSCLDRLLEGVSFCPSLPAPRADGRLSTESLVSSRPHGPLPQGASDFACFCFCGTRHGAGGCRPCGPGLYSSEIEVVMKIGDGDSSPVPPWLPSGSFLACSRRRCRFVRWCALALASAPCHRRTLESCFAIGRKP